MKYIDCIENDAHVRTVITKDLSEIGLAIPVKSDPARVKKSKSKEDASQNSVCDVVFGNSLNAVPSILVDSFGYIPKFLVHAIEILDRNLEVEGLFRKTGSMARLKELRTKVDLGESIDDANPLDVAGLIKQFFRELPEPLLTSTYHDVFVNCFMSKEDPQRTAAILHMCLLLPPRHLGVLRFILSFFARVAARSDQNKMDAANLAVCLTPNLLYTSSADSLQKLNSTDRILQAETAVIQLLISEADKVGEVSEGLLQRAAMLGSGFPPADELEGSEAKQNVSRTAKKKKKKRSSSLQGLVSTLSSLSSSFTRWRNHEKPHNSSMASDRSAMSCVSFENSSVMIDGDVIACQDDDTTLEHFDFSAYPMVTPKLINKRKADDEVMAFSASKRKAILQSMPHRSVMRGVPFTPKVKPGNSMDMDQIPVLDFSDETGIVFSTTPTRSACINKCSLSTAKLNRKASVGQSGCFSPKSNKQNVRNSFRGFFRRLSGNSKDTDIVQTQPDGTSHQNNQASKSGSFFNRTKKTTSLPPVLVTKLMNEFEAAEEPDSPPDMKSVLPNAMKAGEKKNNQNVSLPPRPHRRTWSAEEVPGGQTSLKRGRPNSLKSGLPSPNRRRSVDVTVKGVLDTSPIKSIDGKENQEFCLGEYLGGSRLSLNLDRGDDIATLDSQHDVAFTESMIATEEGDKNSDEISIAGAATEEDCKSGEVLSVEESDGREKAVEGESQSDQNLVQWDAESTMHIGRLDYFGRYPSKQSIRSLDSGLGLGMDAEVQVDPAGEETTADGTFEASFGFSREGRQSLSIRKSTREKRKTEEPNLQVTVDLHSLLSKAGARIEVCDEHDGNKSGHHSILHDGNKSGHHSLLHDGNKSGHHSVLHNGNKSGHHSILDDGNKSGHHSILEVCTKSGSVLQRAKLFGDNQELAEKHESILRFPNSTTRTRHVSNQASKVPSSDVDRDRSASPTKVATKMAPIIPISTKMLRVSFKDRNRREFPDKDAGRMPACFETSKETKDSETRKPASETSTCATPKPKIMSALMTPSMAQRISSRTPGASALATPSMAHMSSRTPGVSTATPSLRNYRSPVKPLKRLQASPRSPHGQKSPMKLRSPSEVKKASGGGMAVSVPFGLDF